MTRIRLLFVAILAGLVLPTTTVTAQPTDDEDIAWVVALLLKAPTPVSPEWTSPFGGDLVDDPERRVEITGITRTTTTFPAVEGLSLTQLDVVRRLIAQGANAVDALRMVNEGTTDYLMSRPILDLTVIDLDRDVASCEPGQFWEVGIAVEIAGFPTFGEVSGLPNFVEGFTNVFTVTCENGMAAPQAALASDDGFAMPATNPLPTFILSTDERHAVAFFHPFSEAVTATVAGFEDTGDDPPPAPYAMVTDPIPPSEFVPFDIPDLTEEQIVAIAAVFGDSPTAAVDTEQADTEQADTDETDDDQTDASDDGAATGNDASADDDEAVAGEAVAGDEVADGTDADGTDADAAAGANADEPSADETEIEQPGDGDAVDAAGEQPATGETESENGASVEQADGGDESEVDAVGAEPDTSTEDDSGSGLGILLVAGAGGVAALAAIGVAMRKKRAEREWQARGAEVLSPMEVDDEDASAEDRRAALQYLNTVVSMTLDRGGVVNEYGMLEIPNSVLEEAAPTMPKDPTLRRDGASEHPIIEVVETIVTQFPDLVVTSRDDNETARVGVRVDKLGGGAVDAAPIDLYADPPIEANDATLASGDGDVALS